MVKLWELSTNRNLIAYTGAGSTGKPEFLAQATFNHTEEFVMYPDEATVSLCVWDARTASRQTLLSLGKVLSLLLYISYFVMLLISFTSRCF